MRPSVSFQEFYDSIWLKIPSIFRDNDANNGNPLQILTLTMAQSLYYTFYLKIAAMDELFDIDRCPPAYLPFLAATINWTLVGTNTDSWRQQLHAAPLLWKIKGTRKGITLAEKLIGYSVFISELWRDNNGMIGPKETLWNSFPESVAVKPWFRTTSPDLQNNIANPSFSDLLPSFNAGTIQSQTNYQTQLSTTPAYNPITGTGSTSRLSKASRINVVLKKDLDLDYTTNGVFTDSNLTEAINLLLEFKPFHVYTNKILVLYDLTDYLYGYTGDPTAGSGKLPGDSILSRENIGINAAVDQDDSMTFYNLQAIDTINDPELSYDDPNYLKGSLVIANESFTLTNTSVNIITDPAYLTGLGFNLSGYAINTQTDNGLSLWNADDFISGYIPGTDVETLIDAGTGNIVYSRVIPAPVYNFYSYPIQLTNLCSLGQLLSNLTTTSNTVSVIENSGFCGDIIILNGTNISINSTTNPSPVSLLGYNSVYTSAVATGGIINATSLYSGNISNDLASWTKQLLTSDLLVFVKYNNKFYRLYKKIHYNYDTTNKDFIVNQYAISVLVGDNNATNLLNGLTFYIIYPTLVADTPAYNNDSITRNTNIAYRKDNKKFNRTSFLDDTDLITYIETTDYTPKYTFDDTTGTLVFDSQNTRNYKTDLPKLFTRGTLLIDDQTGTSYQPVNFNQYDPRNESLWEVLVAPTQEYIGSEPFSSSLWSNYFNVPIEDIYYLLPYTSVDISESAQIAGRSSSRWQAVLASISTAYPTYFCSSRSDTQARRNAWTRGSASNIPIPYKGNNRASVQGYRGDTALFTRTQFISDYGISASFDYQVDNYQYTDSQGVDQTTVYKNGASLDTIETVPQTIILSDILSNTSLDFKTQINPTTDIVSYSNLANAAGTTLQYTPQYEDPFNFAHRQSYYYQNTTNLKPSFYANNIRTDINPYTGSLFTDNFDSLNVNISGLIANQDIYTISNISTNSFILQKQNIFVTWREVNSGNAVGMGQPVAHTFPSIAVLRNGTQLVYGDYWLYSTDPNEIILQSNLVLSIGDIIEIIYDTFDESVLPTYPSYINSSGSNTICTTTNTQHSMDTNVIPSGFGVSNKAFLAEYTFTHNPIVSWYRYDTSAFISTSVDLTMLVNGTPKIAATPIATMYRDLAMPDVKVYKNGNMLTYAQDWYFTSVPSITNWSYRVVLAQTITQALQAYDVIGIQYTSVLES